MPADANRPTDGGIGAGPRKPPVRGVAERAGWKSDRNRCHHVRMPPDARSPADPPATREAEITDAVLADDEAAVVTASEEVVDGLPVLAPVRTLERASPALPAVQAAAAAATGFVAGAATLALVRRHTARKVARVSAKRTVGGLPIIGTRSFLVDVHLIGRSSE